jgi:hypothetical protein
VLPKILESVACNADDEQPWRCGHGDRGDDDKRRRDGALTAITAGRTSATAKPM